MVRTITSGAAAVLILAGVSEGMALESPIEAVRSTVKEVTRLLTDEELKQPAQLAERRRLLEEIIGQRFDYEEMAKRSLAAHWKNRNEAERTEFVKLFQTLLSNTYAEKIEQYSGEQVQYLKERLKDSYAEVQTKVVSAKTELSLDYRLLIKAGVWRVYDVVVNGVSLVRNYRSQFKRIIQSSSYAELVQKLRKKSSEIRAP